MESYLTEIKQLRIPRPKYEPSGNSPPRCYYPLNRPYTPPRDYQLSGNETILATHQRSFHEGGDDFRPTLHPKM